MSVPAVSAISFTRRLIRWSPVKIGQQIQQLNCQNQRIIMASSSQPFSTDNLRVEHDPDKRKFFIKLDTAEAKLEYVKRNVNGNVVMDMWHTEVPPQLQGRGIAKVLAKAAFDYVVDHKLKMKLSCSYLQKYYADNPTNDYKSAIFQG